MSVGLLGCLQDFLSRIKKKKKADRWAVINTALVGE
jgi:hypothetical protein